MNKITIVEDDSAIREELRTLLKNSGYSVESITDFDNLASRLVESDCDLILLDIGLPGENGEVVLQDLRRKKDTPVIMLTSRTGDMDEVLSMSYGADSRGYTAS